jgi:two-component system, NtrC family, sensor kinase
LTPSRMPDDPKRLAEENAGLLDELETIYSQFLLLKSETDVSYAQLRSRNEELEINVEELKQAYIQLEATREQLIHSERLAAMGQLAASIVHEINNPLMILIGYMDMTLMMKDQIPDEGHQYLNVARRHADSMIHLMQDILNFSRNQVIPFGSVEVNDVITHLVAFLGNILRKHITIEAEELGIGLPSVSGNAQQVQQVFTNILTNAADAMDNRGTVKIRSSCCSTLDVRSKMKEIDQHSAFSETEFESHLQDSRAFVCIEFSDDGPGIPDDVIADIFNPFFTTKPAGKGTGLGLSICRTIIERHQGNMLVKSKVGQGTTFIVVLPAAVKVE